MLTLRHHPTGWAWLTWYCGECGVDLKAKGECSGMSCSDCHTVLCPACASKTHHVPAGVDAGKVCLLVTKTVALVA